MESGEIVPKILIVCTANICRSPMAMVLLERKLQEQGVPGIWQVTSAGTWGRDGFPASKHGANLMQAWGMDLGGHSSRIIDKTIIAEADLVLVMEKGHQEALRAEFPELADQIFLLSEMTGYRLDIGDPYGGPKEEYLETAQELERYLDEGLAKIIELAQKNAA